MIVVKVVDEDIADKVDTGFINIPSVRCKADLFMVLVLTFYCSVARLHALEVDHNR